MIMNTPTMKRYIVGAIKAARAAGVEPSRIEIDAYSGKIVVHLVEVERVVSNPEIQHPRLPFIQHQVG